MFFFFFLYFTFKTFISNFASCNDYSVDKKTKCYIFCVYCVCVFVDVLSTLLFFFFVYRIE